MKDEICDYCERLFDKPSIGCKFENKHRVPDIAQKIAHAIEQDLRGRGGMDWGDIDDEVQEEIREAWAEIIRQAITNAEKAIERGDTIKMMLCYTELEGFTE